MSKVYENHLQMEELAQDNGWQEHMEEQQKLTQEDMNMMKAFEDFIGNVEEVKAQEFALKVMEV